MKREAAKSSQGKNPYPINAESFSYVCERVLSVTVPQVGQQPPAWRHVMQLDALLRQQQESLSHLLGLYYMMHGEEKTNNLKGDYNALRKQLATELNKKKGFKLNLKVTTDKTETYPDLPKRYTLGSPYFEKWIEGETPTLTYTKKELDGVTAYLKGQMNRSSTAKTGDDDFLPKDEFPF